MSLCGVYLHVHVCGSVSLHVCVRSLPSFPGSSPALQQKAREEPRNKAMCVCVQCMCVYVCVCMCVCVCVRACVCGWARSPKM